MDNNIIEYDYNGIKILVRESDGWFNISQMCKDNGKRLDNWLRLKTSQAEMADLLNILTSETVSQNPYDVMIQRKEGRGGGTWAHPILATKIARWISPPFANWCDAHIVVLGKTGSTTLDQNPFERMMQIMAEDYEDLNRLMPNDDRFGDASNYSHWTLDEGEEF